MNNDLLYQIALTQVPHIGDVHAKALVNVFQHAQAIFEAPKQQLERIEGIGTIRANSIKRFRDFNICEAEIKFIEKNKIEPLFVTSEKYPKRLLHCIDSPPLLYYKGNANLNANKIISIVGTRNHSEYGKIMCEQFIEDLKNHSVTIVSGLAYGIDSIAHKSAIKNNLPTIAILAHGLDKIYPPQNKLLAKQMIEHGGLLTDFKSGSNTDKQNFPKRNRITAGMCDALIVIETGATGGSLITAEQANGYNKDVFAVPGRITDSKSEGCNRLIKNNKAALISCAKDLIQMMNWEDIHPLPKKQRQLFIELSPSEKKIIQLIEEAGQMHIDDLIFKSGFTNSVIAGTLLNLEMNSLIQVSPGKLYKIL